MLIVVAVTVAALLPFIGKAFNMDDPLFLWAAKHIITDPLNFYGFNVNWYGYMALMSEVMKNPPLGSYFIAVAAMLGGWGERALHLFFLLPAVAASTGTYMLASRFTSRPLLATLTAIFTPAFLVSAATIMCDVLMLAFWVWAIYFWLRGTEEGCKVSMLASVVLIALSALTKYFGICLLPLLTAHSIASRHEVRRWLPLVHRACRGSRYLSALDRFTLRTRPLARCGTIPE